MYIGIDVGGTNIKVGLVNSDGGILKKLTAPTLPDRHYSTLIADMAELSKKVVAQADIDMSAVKSIGIGIPGSCDDEAGVVGLACNLNFKNVPIREQMQKYIDKPVHIGNDADCAALGEYSNFEKKPGSMVLVTLGTGIGGGIILDGKLYTGVNSTAGEIGHTMLVKGGRQCSCGRKGCWETYGSVTGLIASTKEEIEKSPDSIMAAETKITGRTAFDAARKGDAAAIKVVREWIISVSDGVVDIINIFQPEILCIGGAISAEEDIILPRLRSYVSENQYKGSDRQTQIMMAKLGNDAGLIGAAFLGKNI